MAWRQLGLTGLRVPPIMLGCWQIGGLQWSRGDTDEVSLDLLRWCIAQGVGAFDTAPVYGLGHSEELIGRAIAGHRGEVFVASKAGQVWDTMGAVRTDNRPEVIARQVEESLRRLGTEYIDLYQLHKPDPQVPLYEALGAMGELVTAGKVRAVGVCRLRSDELVQYARGPASFQSVQNLLNLLQPDALRHVLPWCQRGRVAFLAYGPMGHGLLTGRYSEGDAFRDWRADRPLFTGAGFRRALDKVSAMRKVAETLGVSLSRLAVAWVLDQPGVTAAICGAHDLQQFEDTLSASNICLDVASRRELSRIFGVPTTADDLQTSSPES